MKKRFFANNLIVIGALFVLSGCTITIMHQFEQPPVVINNYYQGSGGDSPQLFPENNTLSTSDLGVGYDIIRTDPEYWSKNSVEGVGVRPRVFEFSPNPDPNATIDLPKLNREAIRRRMPLGVNAETNSEFKWEEEMKYISSASDFQRSYGSSFSAGGGAMGVAFSASAAFNNTQAKTSEEQKKIAYKNGAFRGLQMEIDFNTPQQLTSQFKDAINELGTDPKEYDEFIKNWGTHFTKVVTIGAKCAYQLEFSKEDLSTRYESDKAFDVSVSGSMAGVSVEASAGYSDSKKEGIRNSTGAENIRFVSYGGSGAGINDFPKWTEHAVENPTLIDAYLESYETLFTKDYFSEDPLITTKKTLFQDALKRYYIRAQNIVDALPKAMDIAYTQVNEYKVEYREFYYKTGPENGEVFWGNLSLGLYDQQKLPQSNLRKWSIFDYNKDRDLTGTFFPIDPNTEIVLKSYIADHLRANNDEIETVLTRTLRVTPEQVKSGFFVSLTGQIFCEWWGDNALTKLQIKNEDEGNIVNLADIPVGETKVRPVEMIYKKHSGEDFSVIITYSVTRIK